LLLKETPKIFINAGKLGKVKRPFSLKLCLYILKDSGLTIPTKNSQLHTKESANHMNTLTEHSQALNYCPTKCPYTVN